MRNYRSYNTHSSDHTLDTDTVPDIRSVQGAKGASERAVSSLFSICHWIGLFVDKRCNNRNLPLTGPRAALRAWFISGGHNSPVFGTAWPLFGTTLPYLGKRDPYLGHVRSILGRIKFRANRHVLHWPMRSRIFHRVKKSRDKNRLLDLFDGGNEARSVLFVRDFALKICLFLQIGGHSCCVWLFGHFPWLLTWILLSEKITRIEHTVRRGDHVLVLLATFYVTIVRA